MPADLTSLPGYPGHDHVRTFALDCLRDIAEEILSDDDKLRAELARRVALIPEERFASLAPLSPQTVRMRLRVWLNPIDGEAYNAWTAEERTEQLQWRGSNAVSAHGRRQRWAAWYGLTFELRRKHRHWR